MNPKREDNIICDSKETSLHSFSNKGNHHVPRPVGSRSYSDSDTMQFEDRSLSKLKESDRCTATENLFLDTLSLDSPDDADEPQSQRLEQERFLSSTSEVCSCCCSVEECFIKSQFIVSSFCICQLLQTDN